MNKRTDSTSARLRVFLVALAAACAAGCVTPIDPGGETDTILDDDDPLAVPTDLDPLALDALQRDIIAPSCAAQPGLCHHGQFEPNLSTAALTYENMVGKPGIEHNKQYRVDPGSPGTSLVIDKLRNNNVLSRMPLGADPLPEEDIAALEQWIAGGALRRPGEAKAPVVNNPPDEPQVAVFDDMGNRLDAAGPFSAAAGQALVLRHSVQDFETDDADIPFAGFVLQLADGRQIKLSDAPGAENIGLTTYEANGPEGKGDLLSHRYDWTLPSTVDLIGADGTTTTEPTAGMALTVLALYVDSTAPNESFITFSVVQDLIQVTP